MVKRYKRILAAAMAVMLTVQGMGMMGSVKAQNKMTKVRSQSQTQMSSDPEVVYVNSYSDATVRTQNFDSNWKFYLGEAGEAQTPGYDDSKWRQISLPHDYSIEQEFSQSLEAESGYLPGGTGWYRKNFVVGNELEGKRVRIDFDGVYMNATVWVNGHRLGMHPYGYTPFSFDITDYVEFGSENTIAVKVDHKTPSSRWYSGSGIYRSVNLTFTDDVHVDLYGIKIETPNLEAEQGGNVTMNVTTNVVNESAEAKDVSVTHTVFEKGGDAAANIGTVTTQAQSMAAGAAAVISADLTAANPVLWDVENPQLYTVRTEVKVGDEVVDTYDSDFGFRYFAIDNNTGFSLNGEKLKLKGVCMHHDQGSLGAVANRRAIERQVEILQEMGCNSIRVTHNPAAQALIEVCNEKGILVIDEFFDGWMFHKNGNSNDYATWFNAAITADNEILHKESGMTWAEFDLKATIRRAQNAPSVIMWSLGNEIQEGAGGNGYHTKARDLITWAQEVDTTRLLTIGSNAVKNGWQEHIDIGNQLTAVGGLSGTNYSNGASYDALHAAYPEWNLYGSETASSVNSRGIYTTKDNNRLNADKQLTSYDKSSVGWGAFASAAWYDVITRDFVAGEYVWTGFDYIGEPTPANGIYGGPATAWPSPKNSFFGIVDTAGFPKDSYYLYQSQWNEDVNTLHILPAWNENALMKDGNNNVEVVVYSDAAKVKLFLNDRLVGEQTFTKKTTAAGYSYQTVNGQNNHKSLYMTFSVPFEEGTLRAEAYDAEGNLITNTQGRSEVTTTGAAAELSASADRTEIAADGKDLAYITVDVTDEDGNIVPDAANRVTFDVEGEGVLVGVDNGSSPDHDSYKGTSRKAFSGKVLAIVQSTKNAGNITVTATADGLKTSVVNITTKAVDDGTAAEKQVNSFLMSKTYYVKAGNMPQLPTEIEARYTDGSSEKLAVKWEDIAEDQIQAAGSFTVKGQVAEQFNVSVNINMIDTIGGLLNYSTTTPVGVVPTLPEARPAVMQDGTIMDVAFAVNWEEKDDAVYSEPGNVEVNGTANVLGQEFDVTASIRVQDEKITVGDSISAAGYLSQDIPENMQSDTLDAIKDGNTVISDNTSGGANPTAWSNWKNSQQGDTTAEITFRYDTQQRLGEIVVYFARDNGSMRFPDAGATEIYISEDGSDGSWTKVEAAEEIASDESSARVKPYTYKFTPVSATFVKFCLTNYSGTTGTSQKPCTGITEIELKEAKGAFVTNTTAEFESLTVNGTELSAADIAKGSYSTAAIFADVEAVPADNAAVTVLPVYEDTIRIIIESEDHKTRNMFEIYLNQEEISHLPADDDSRDYPREKCAAFADSEYLPGSANEGPARYVVDGNANTHWHTNWRTTEAKDINKRWVGITLEEPTRLESLRYLPRSGNGDVTEYKVQYRETEDGEWKDIAAGTWTRDGKTWKLAEFDRPVVAKQVRLVGVHTWADSGNDAHMSVSELRVRKTAEKVDITGEDFVITVPETVEVTVADAEHPVEAEVTVTNGDTTLRYGIDYLLAYENNTAFGTASVTIKGIGVYGGTVTRQFEIVEKAAVDGYRVTVDGVETIYQYNDKVQLTAPEVPNGQKFAGWVADGEVISTNPKYEFYVSGDITITSKFVASDAEVEKEEAKALLTNVIVTDREDGKCDIKFVAQLVVPEGYTIEEAGLVWSNKGKSDPDELTLQNAEDKVDGVKVTKITKISNTWQYSVTIKGVPKTTMVPGRAFAKMVNETTGEIVYSGIKLGNK